MKEVSKKDQRRLEVISLFGIIPNIPETIGEDRKNMVFDFWGALYWGMTKKPFEKKWAEDADDVIPNEINVFQYRKNLSETGTGSDPHQAYEDAVLRMNMRRIKRGAEVMLIRSGFFVKNGKIFYYTLDAEVMKIKK